MSNHEIISSQHKSQRIPFKPASDVKLKLKVRTWRHVTIQYATFTFARH